MKRRNYTRYIKFGWVLILLLLLVGFFATPGPAVNASKLTVQNKRDTVGLKAKVYLTQSTLKPLFQDRINQQIPVAVDAAINGIVNKLPGVNQGWAGQMARTLLSPSATLTQLTPQQDGLNATVHFSLYPNDPKPTDMHMLVKFSVLNASTVQVSAQPLNGSPALVNGPLTTIKVPVGQLNAINATPNCGDANLAIGLQVPVDLAQGNAQTQPNTQDSAQADSQASYVQPSAQAANSSILTHSTLADFSANRSSKHDNAVNSYIEIPADSLSTLGDNVGNIQLSRSLSAQNIQLNVQDSQMVVTADIMGSFLGAPVRLAKATTNILPAAQGGKLVLNVQDTQVTVAIVTFSQNSYNQQIQQLLNDKLGNALGGNFNVTSVSLGGNSPVSCAASDSLMLTGTANLQ
ncbi:MAG: hypothetical protein H0U76_20225 [Ktedonobacteraceae bacterium]|nr:hypothetical protein [Ktedonobacteraceae bacterium]